MEINNLFGLPAHPLVVHAAVVLLPLAAIATIAAAAIPRARRHYAPVAFALALLATFAVGLAQQSGESLESRVDRTALVRDHTHQAERVFPWAVALTIVAAGVALVDPLRRRMPDVPVKAATAVLLVGSLAAGAGATVTVVQVGHSGAKATWHDTESGGDGG
ncbi:MAG: DUF2231 domain-containing protein [Ilumatobacteraceae bacterium]